MRKKTVHFVSAPAGAGKTHWLRRSIQRERGLFNHLYLANNGDLISEMKTEFERMGLMVDVITTDTHPNGVKKAAIDYFKKCKGCGHILLMTHQAYAMDLFIPSEGRWKLWIDEFPQFAKGHSSRLPTHMSFLTDHVEIADFNQGASRVFGKPSLGNVIREGFLDDMMATQQKLFLDVGSKKFDVFVHTESWKKAVGSLGKKERSTRVRFISVPNPRYFGNFEQVTILGANFEDSLVYHYLRDKVNFVPHPDFIAQPRPCKRPLSARVKIFYLLESDRFSKNLAQKPYAQGTSILERMEQIVIEKMGDAEFLYAVNKDRERRTALKKVKRAKLIPANAIGINSLSDYHAVAYLAAVNPHPAVGTILKSLELSREIVTRAVAHDWVYQAVMRCSARDPHSEHDIVIIVPDRGTAERLVFLLEVTSMEKLGDIVLDEEEQVIPYNDAEKQSRLRAKMRIEKLRDRVSLPSPYNKALGNVSRSATGDEILDRLIDVRGQPLSIILTHQLDLYSKKHEDFEIFPLRDFLDLKKFIKGEHSAPCDKKDCRTMYNPAYFGPPVPGKKQYRTQENFRCATALVMDIDGGNLSPEQFCAIFGDDPGQPKLAFLLYSSFSYRPGNNRFHAVFPLKHPIMSIDDFKIVYWHLLKRIQGAGLNLVEAKIDLTFLSGIQSAYMPRRDRAYTGPSLFIERRCARERDVKRFALDPDAIIQLEKQLSKQEDTRSYALYRPDPQRIEALKNEVRSLSEGRRTPFYALGWKLLLGCGLPLDEVEHHLREVITDPKMSDWLKRNMKDYGSGGWTWRKRSKIGQPVSAMRSKKIVNLHLSEDNEMRSGTLLSFLHRSLPVWLSRYRVT